MKFPEGTEEAAGSTTERPPTRLIPCFSSIACQSQIAVRSCDVGIRFTPSPTFLNCTIICERNHLDMVGVTGSIPVAPTITCQKNSDESRRGGRRPFRLVPGGNICGRKIAATGGGSG
jgi:hypothetical protein